MNPVSNPLRWSFRGNAIAALIGRSSKHLAAYISPLLMCLLFSSCELAPSSSDSPTVDPLAPPTSNGPALVILPAQVAIDEGGTAQLRVFERMADGGAGREVPGAGFTWSTSDASVAGVESGLVRASTLGSARITVSIPDGRKATSEVRVIRQVSRIEIVGGAGQSGPVATALGGEIVAKFTSKLGRPVEGAAVGFAVISGGGSTSVRDAVTGADGISRTEWTLGPVAGEQAIEVRLSDNADLASRVVSTARPGPATLMSVQPALIGLEPGTAMQIGVIAQDMFGNRIEQPAVSWRTDDPAIAQVSSSGVLTGNNDGTTFVTATMDAGAAAPGGMALAPGSLTGHGTVKVGKTGEASISYEGNGQTGTVGIRLPSPLKIKVVTPQGKGIPQLGVSWVVTSGGGSVNTPQTKTSTTGQTEVSWTLGTTAGAQSLEASVAGLPPIRFSASALAGGVSRIEIRPSSAQVKLGESVQFQAVATDRYGNLKNTPASWSAIDPGTASVSSNGLARGVKAGSTQIRAVLEGISNTSTVEVTLSAPDPVNVPPVAGFTAACTLLTCDFTDSSTDSDGSISTRTWTFGDGGTLNVASTTVRRVYAVAGTYNVTLKVTDDKGATHQMTKPVTVSGSASSDPNNKPPVASFATDCVELRCAFTDNSTDPDGQIAGRTWSFGDQSTALSSETAQLVYTFAAAGTYSVTLQVTDDKGATSNMSKVTTVTGTSSSNPGNAAPVANFTYQCQQLVCSFVDASTDSDGQIAARSWTFGNVGSSAQTSPSYTFPAAGTYSVKLEVTDDKGVKGSATKSVAVSSGSTPPPSGSFQRVLADTTVNGEVLVPEGQTWLIGRNVKIAGNLRTVGGTIAMRPGSSVQFLGAKPHEYVGGGMTYSDALVRDIGVWVGPQGALDIQCTPKTGWNRTGVDPTWLPTDEYWIAPTNVGDFKPRRWSPGQPIPRVDPRVPAAEVVNVTRDCSVTGPAHIHIHSQRAQRIEYLQLRNMGIASSTVGGDVLGRYALHMHMSGEGTRGSIVRGVAAVNSRGKVFVPHTSHGTTWIDNVSVNSFGEGMWWDQFHVTNDLLIDRMLVMGVEMPDSIAGVQGDTDAYNLHAGRNVEIRNSVAAGVHGDKLAVCFDWVQPQATDPNAQLGLFVWKFDTGNVAHNCRGPGARFSTNLQEQHHVNDFVTYRNAGSSSENGAYVSSTRYSNMISFEDGYRVNNDNSYEVGGFIAWANASGNAGISNATITSREGPAIYVTNRQLPAEAYFVVQDVTLIPAAGQPKVYVGPGVQETTAWKAHFIRSGVTPADIVFASSSRNEGSEVLIDHEDGRKWRVTYQNGQKVVTNR